MSGFTGSKAQAGVFERIIGQMPPHSVYVEPFLGTGQIFKRKKRALTNLLFDLSRDLLARIGADAGVIAKCGDALELLPGLALWLPPDALIYADPPYPLGSRLDKGRRYYTDLLVPGCREMTDAQHEQLLAMLKTFQCKVMLSTYPNEIYGRQLQGWRCIEYKTRTRGATVTELLYCNFPEPDELHDWRFAGRDFRERWRLEKLRRRTIAKLEAMSTRQRGYVLDAISQRRDWREAPAISATNGDGGRDAVAASARVSAKVVQDKSAGGFVGTARLGQLEVFKTGPREQQMQAMLDIQDWAFLHGKTPQFENL